MAAVPAVVQGRCPAALPVRPAARTAELPSVPVRQKAAAVLLPLAASRTRPRAAPRRGTGSAGGRGFAPPATEAVSDPSQTLRGVLRRGHPADEFRRMFPPPSRVCPAPRRAASTAAAPVADASGVSVWVRPLTDASPDYWTSYEAGDVGMDWPDYVSPVACEVTCSAEAPARTEAVKEEEGLEGKGQLWGGDPTRRRKQGAKLTRWPALWRRAWRFSGDSPDSLTPEERLQFRALFASGIESPTFARPRGAHFRRIVASLLGAILQDGGSVARVSMSMALLVLSKHCSIYAPRLLKQAVDPLQRGVTADNVAATVAAVQRTFIFYAGSRLLQAATHEARDLFFAQVGQNARRKLLRQVYAHLHSLEYGFHAGRSPACLTRIIERGERAVDLTTSALVFQFFPTMLELGMIWRSVATGVGQDIALTMAATAASYVAWTVPVTHWRSRFKQVMNRYENISSGRANDALTHHELVKAHNAEKHEVDRWDHVQQAYSQAAVKHRWSLALLNMGQRTILATGLAQVLRLAASKVAQGRMTLGDLVMIKTYMFQIQRPMEILGMMYRQTRQGLVDLSNMFTLLHDMEPLVTDLPGAPDLPPGPGAVEIRAVSYRYPVLVGPTQPGNPALDRLTLVARPGEVLGVVGPSGCGKTSIARLLTRMFDPESGSVRIDGSDLREVTQSSVRKAVAVVPQTPLLFNDTIAYNICYGTFDASVREVEAAARGASVHRLIVETRNKYHSIVGPGGCRLSGGERQRIILARSLLRNPRIIVYDEATSALDPHSEEQVQAALKARRRDSTTIVIAHRLSTIRHCDRIVVMEHGRVVEEGTHEELMRKGGLYHSMWTTQHKQLQHCPDRDSAEPSA
eukprot:TRINITY_DN25933_c0_g1_i1.p1 TRINITY_DN25933_c0_g1~~TRINITY_DN25933_c0_g1_i1.p1  ORF type:complete len:860 (+),score=174.90 TRINITY_DN25933_c0_g1_i1:52-2631(+)